jgi:hypothetical protein
MNDMMAMILMIIMMLIMMMMIMMIIGTMACIWCIKTQFIKRMSMAFHRWRLNSTMISWVLLNKTTTTTTNIGSSDRSHHHDNNTSRSSYYDDDEEDGYGSISSNVVHSRLRRNSSPSLTRLIPHKGMITQRDNNHNDDDNNDDDDVCDLADNGNNQDNGTITDAVQIALKIVDRYKTSSKSSPTKKKVIDIQSLLAYKGIVISAIHLYKGILLFLL